MSDNLKEIRESGKAQCGFCKKSDVDSLIWGPMYEIEDVAVHYFCMLFSAQLTNAGEDHEGILGFLVKDIKKEIGRGKRLKCKYCKKPGATIGCCIASCPQSCHYTCGIEEGVIFQFTDFLSFCPKHGEERKPKIRFKKKQWACPICLETSSDEKFPIKPPCCNKKNAVFHRPCIMKYAVTAGLHFLKCPMCNDKEKFPKAMQLQGVFVPDRDAEWEREPNAFAELKEKYSRCDIQPCLCPDGRDFDGKREWRIIRCGGCAAAGAHMKCGKLPVLSYRCDLCAPSLIGCSLEGTKESESEEEETGSSCTESDSWSESDITPIVSLLPAPLAKVNLSGSPPKKMSMSIFGRKVRLASITEQNDDSCSSDDSSGESDLLSTSSICSSISNRFSPENSTIQFEEHCSSDSDTDTIPAPSSGNIPTLKLHELSLRCRKSPTTFLGSFEEGETIQMQGNVKQMLFDTANITKFPSYSQLTKGIKVPDMTVVKSENMEMIRSNFTIGKKKNIEMMGTIIE